MSDCVLCRIVDRTLAARILYEDDLVLAVNVPKDHPVKLTPVHFLVVPKVHLASAREAEPRHEAALGRLVTVAARIARQLGIDASGYRLTTNTGEDAGQTVFHLHLHCLGGRKLGSEA
jgi:histidine triad (HIT) family protein